MSTLDKNIHKVEGGGGEDILLTIVLVHERHLQQHYHKINKKTHKNGNTIFRRCGGFGESTKNELVWPFTSNAGRGNGKKKFIQVETDVNTTTRKTKEQMGRLYNKWYEETENKELD